MGQCSAKSKRFQKPCQKWAVRGKTTCHMHGGTSKGPKTSAGKKASRLAVLKHGAYTKEAKCEHREAMELIRQSKNLLESFKE